MTKKQFYEEMGNLDELTLLRIRLHLGWIVSELPSEVARAMQFTKLSMLLDDLIEKKRKEVINSA